jgi:hypothetical protein
MTSIPPGIAAQMALNQQNVALSVIKQAADADKAIANILQTAADSVPASTSRGGNVNIRA